MIFKHIDNLRKWMLTDESPDLKNLDLSNTIRYLTEPVVLELVLEIKTHLDAFNDWNRSCGEVRVKTDRDFNAYKGLLFELAVSVANADELVNAADNVRRCFESYAVYNPPSTKYQRAKMKLICNEYNSQYSETVKEVQVLHGQNSTAKVKATQALLKKTEDERRAAEYAALLAEGRKQKTLQQAYANGDFIPVDDGPGSGPLKSRTGHRLGSRG